MNAIVDKATDLMRRGRTANGSCRPRPDGAIIHRTTPLQHPQTGRLIGHSCPCDGIFTAAGNPSQPDRIPSPQAPGRGRPSKAHAARTVAHVMGRP